MGVLDFFRKLTSKDEEKVVETSTKIGFEELFDSDDTYLTKLATEIINGKPLIINLENLDIDNANKVIAFLSGVVYAIDGEIFNIRERIFLFGNSEVYTDGSVHKFLDDIS